jgi:hypothetical protein
MELRELPENTRLKLPTETEEELWNIVGKEGVKAFAEKKGYSVSKMYNWKNSSDFIPVRLVREVLEYSPKVLAIKGEGRSGTVENPRFDFPEIDELLTRIAVSVTVNQKGSPMYQTDDIGNLERFSKLLGKIGEGPYKVYSRENYYQVNYPKFLHEILERKSFDEKENALIDEKAIIKDDFFVLDDRRIKISEFSSELYSRQKSARLAMERGDRDKLEKIIALEARKAENLFS